MQNSTFLLRIDKPIETTAQRAADESAINFAPGEFPAKTPLRKEQQRAENYRALRLAPDRPNPKPYTASG